MSEFIIPKGKPYEFSVRVVAKDSFLAQDLSSMSSATFELIEIDTGCVYDTAIHGTVVDSPLDGQLKFVLSDVYTDGLTVVRGDKVDGYYPKVSYQGVVTVTFSDANIENRVSIIDEVFVVPTSCIA